MSRPYQFSEENSTRSPLDRQPQNLYPAGQPPSFKTNVNRAKTKRWVEAKTISYDGDDWGEYDEYDEYGADEPPAQSHPPAPVPTGLRQKGQSAIEAGRSFTDPQPPRQYSIPRKNSFDAGDERRAFSSAAPQGYLETSPADPSRTGGIDQSAPPQNQQYPPQTIAQPQPINTNVPPGNRLPSAAQSEASDTPQHRRDFSPSALPPPLHTRASPAPGSASGSPAGARFPPRKSSISQPSPSDASGPHFPTSVPSNASAQSPRDRAPSNPTKPLPFIRPADIYKRVEEERVRERQSIDSGRPSLDSLSSKPSDDPMTGRGVRERTSAESLGRSGRRPSLERHGDASESGRSLQPLAPVAERKSEYLPDFNFANPPQPSSFQVQQRPTVQTYHPIALPEVQNMGGFADDFSPRYFAQDSATSQGTTGLSPQQAGGDPGLRSMVDQAFTRKDDSSVPPTPISKRDTYSQSEDGISRSNTESSSGISPIMSRVPSSATSALKARNVGGAETSTPAIAEETSETSTPTSRPPSAAVLGGGYKINRKPSPAHSRNVSAGSLVAPSSGESPARSPAIEPQKAMVEPEAAVLSTLSPLSPSNAQDNKDAMVPNYATREADIATVAKESPDTPAYALGEVQKESQKAFLESHHGTTSELERPPRSRSESPSKGRVQELAGKFGGTSDSRRGSASSSIASWERSQEDLPGAFATTSRSKPGTRDTSPVKGSLSQRPTAHHEPSFRPKLPGQWESYATNVPTPLEEPNQDYQPVGTSRFAAPAAHMDNNSDTDEEIDLTPTTKRHSASPPKADPLAALQAAGAAMGEAIKASVGMGTSSTEPEKTRETSKVAPGNVFLRPLQLDRTVSEAPSSNPPSPPPKDGSFENLTPESNHVAPPPPLTEKTPNPHAPFTSEATPTRPSMLPQLSTDPSAHDQESDRLRKEIVRSLSPLKQTDTSFSEASHSSLQPVAAHANNRESSILPSEYDSYWNDGDSDKDVARQSVVQPSDVVGAGSAPLAEQAEQKGLEARPGLLDNRFSWEKSLDRIPQSSASVVPTSQAEPVESLAPAHAAAASLPEETYAGIPEPYFGPGHASSGAPLMPQITEPEQTPGNRSLEEPVEITNKADSSTHHQANELTSPTSLNKRLSSEGLHVVNSAVDPEAVDMPPRLVEEEAPEKVEEVPQLQKPTSHDVPLGPRPPTSKGAQPLSPTDKPLGFREILAIRSAPDRIATYNKTRDYWATTDHGLSEWMTKAMAAAPEHASFPGLSSRPTAKASGSMRHRPTASISLFGKSTGSNAQQPAPPYFEQYNTAASQMPSGGPPTTPGGTPYQQTPSTGGAGPRLTSQQLEKKGKDLLHTAGVFGGKATTVGKGLFAKGKSRFKSGSNTDKASRSSISSAPTSREPSEEPPEWITAPKQFENSRSSVDLGDHKDKKRRFSSPFGRSRSRPTSIVLPQNQHLDHANGSIHSRDTPLQETPPAESSRPHSYAAPDSWSYQDPHSQHNVNMTPPRSLGTPDRLGILPSPAKSAFSLAQAEKEGDVPPVPPIPANMEDWEQQRVREREMQSHRNLQSVIRHSTPPVPESMRSQSTELAPTQRSLESSSEQASKFKPSPAASRDVEEKEREPSWPLVSNPPSSEKADDFAATPTDPPSPQNSDDDKLSQLHHKPQPVLTEASNHLQLSEEEVDDDNPPQLQHESLPISAPLGQSGQFVDVSPASAPQASDRGDISPVMSSSGHEPSNDDNRAPPPLDLNFLSRNPQLAKSGPDDVSPVLGSQQVDFARDEHQRAVGHGLTEGASTPTTRPAYETARIGAGDVSPVSSHSNNFPDPDETTPTKIAILKSSDRPVNPRAGSSDAPTIRGQAYRDLSPMREQSSNQAPSPTSNLSTPGVHIPGAFLETPMEKPGATHQIGRQVEDNRMIGPPQYAQGNSFTPSSNTTSHAVSADNPAQKVVDDYEPSRSSMDSWEHDSNGEQIILPHDRASPARHDLQEGVAMAVTPQAAKTVNIGSYFRPQDVQQPQRTIQQATQPPLLQERSALRVAGHEPQQQNNTPPKATAGTHKRSQSLISSISNAVSAEALANLPISERSQESRPSSGNRQMPNIAADRVMNTPPPQIVYASLPQSNNQNMSPIHDDGLDLYADHNGIVKDLHDEQTGEPVRIVTAPSAPAPHPPAQHPHVFAPSPIQEGQSGLSSAGHQRGGNGGSRPMSFVSLPRDAKGRPQEQLNREVHDEEPGPETLPRQPIQETLSVQRPTASSPLPPGTQGPNEHEIPSAAVDVAAAGVLQKEVGIGSADSERQTGMVPPQQPSAPIQGPQGPPQGKNQNLGVQAQPPQQQAGGQMPYEGQYAQDPKMVDPRLQDSRTQQARTQDPRVQDPRTQDPRSQGQRMQNGDPKIQDPRQQDPPQNQLYPPQDPRLQGRTSGQASPQDPRMQGGQFPPPRNEYEAQQQMMARQAMDPRLLAAEYQLPGVGPPSKQGKPSVQDAGRPKLGSVFKSFGNRKTPPPSQMAPSNRINPQLISPDDQHRALSYESSLGDLPTEQLKEKKKERKSSLFSSLNSRPQSVGTESQFSQESRVAHAADSRIDLRHPSSPAPFQGIPPQIPPPGAPQPPKSQPNRASTSVVPDGGKKKRFSGLGSLFGRHGSTGHVPPAKPQKLSKEEKKRQKAAPGQQYQQPQHPIQGYGQPPVFPQPYGAPPAMHPQDPRMQQGPKMQQQDPRMQVQDPRMQQQGPRMQQQDPRMQQQNQRMRQQDPRTQQQDPRMHQQYFPPQQGVPQQYMSAQSPPGVQGYVPQRTSTQSPPGAQGYGPQRANPQGYFQQPQAPSESYRQSQQQSPPISAQGGQQQYFSPHQNSSETPRYPTAYGETRQLAQSAAQQGAGNPPSVSPAPTRHISPQSSRPDPLPTNPSFEHTSRRTDEHGEMPPPGGYYAPNRFPPGQDVGYGNAAGQGPPSVRVQDQRRVSSPISMHGSSNGVASPVSQRSVSSPIPEPRYETPQIPAAYSNGAAGYATPSSRAPSLPNKLATAARKSSSPSPYNGPVRQFSDSHRPDLSPQVSGQSQYDSAGGHREQASPPLVSPVSNPSPGMPSQPNQSRKGPAPRMGSISEATNHQERPYNISLPIEEGAEHEAAYIQQQQMIHQQEMEAQNQAQGFRNGHMSSPSPPQTDGRPFDGQGGQGSQGALAGFREVLPRHSPQPYQMPPPPQQQPSTSHPEQGRHQPPSHSRTPEPAQPPPIHPFHLQTGGGPVQPAAYPLPMSPSPAETRSPVNPIAAALPPPPPPKAPRSPFVPHHPSNDVVDDEAPPSYSTHEGANQAFNDEKAYSPESPASQRPPPQRSPPPHLPPPQIPPPQLPHSPREYVEGDDPSERGRKPSISILQHPQPSTMGASPQRSSTDMGSAILRQRLLEQEERDRLERLQRTETERVESERERAERERARARARELERSRGSVRTMHMGATASGAQRPMAFELSAEEDEPVMRGVSYPGMEWTPAWDGDF